MSTPMLVWIITAASVAAIIFAHFAVCVHKCATEKHHHPIVEIGSEDAEFWIPGDPEINPHDTGIEDFEAL